MTTTATPTTTATSPSTVPSTLAPSAPPAPSSSTTGRPAGTAPDARPTPRPDAPTAATAPAVDAPRPPRVTGAPRRQGPAGYPLAATRPGVRKVRVGAPSARRTVELEDELERPLREQPPAPLPDPTAQCCAVVRAAVEVLRGERPAAQLARWVTPQVRDQLVERARLLREHAAGGTVAEGAGNRPVLVRRVRLVRLGEDVAEATVVLDDDGRVRAAAVRLEARRGTWRVAVLEIG